MNRQGGESYIYLIRSLHEDGMLKTLILCFLDIHQGGKGSQPVTCLAVRYLLSQEGGSLGFARHL